MARYTINIGNDFPLGDDHEPGYNGGHGGPGHNSGHNSGHHSGRGDWRWGRHGPRAGTWLRVLFVLAIAGIVITHPIKTALIVGVVLLVRRAPWAVEVRERAREAFRRAWPEAAQRMESWRAQRWAQYAHRRGEPSSATDRDDDDHGEGRRGYRGFV